MVSLCWGVCKASRWRHRTTVPAHRHACARNTGTLQLVAVADVFYIFNSTVVDWNCFFFFLLLFCWPCVSIYLFLNINGLEALNFIISLLQASTCFEHHVLIVRRAKIVLYSLWYHHTYRWPPRAQSSLNLCTGRPPTGVMIPGAV